jgi:hypothetical protein
MHRLARRLSIVGAVVALCAIAHADGFDVLWYLARAGPATHPLVAFGIVIGAMLVNYALNYAVIGRPVVKTGLFGKREIVGGIVLLTFWGQLADRVGFVPAGILAEGVARPLHMFSEGELLILLIAFNFVFSALSVGALAYYFVRRVWKQPVRLAWKIAGWAALITNPAWAMALWWL